MHDNTNPTRPKVLVFDVYETLLDMNDMERKINVVLESKTAYKLWFELFMQYCFANNSLDTYQDFMAIANATLQMTGNEVGKPLSYSESVEIIFLLKHLPVHEEVQSCLSELNDLDYTLIALTNAPEKIVCERMERTGLISYFENVLSADKIRKYKPEKELYEWAAHKLGVSTNEMLMITCHGWDIAGAANAGMKTAFLRRDRQLFYPLSPPPDLSYETLPTLVAHLRKEKKGTD